MLTAIEAPLYDVGVLSDRGMLPRLDGIPTAAVFDRLSLLKYRNAHGSHIYIRPSGKHRFTTLDDLNKGSLRRLSADGFTPCAVVETSAGNFQASNALLKTTIYPAIPALQSELPTSGELWRRRGDGPSVRHRCFKSLRRFSLLHRD